MLLDFPPTSTSLNLFSLEEVDSVTSKNETTEYYDLKLPFKTIFPKLLSNPIKLKNKLQTLFLIFLTPYTLFKTYSTVSIRSSKHNLELKKRSNLIH